MASVLTKRYMVDIKLPTGYSKKTFEKAMGYNSIIEYGDDENPMVFTDDPREVKQRFIQFYGMVAFVMNVYDLDEKKVDTDKKV